MRARSDSYHHKNLREALIEAASKFVAEEGHEGLSVRKLASLVGVSNGAPYHHFPDRRSLLIAVALSGYRRLFDEGRAASENDTGPVGRIYQFGMSFLRFSAKNHMLMTLMYESELTRPLVDPNILEAQQEGFNLFRDEVRSLGSYLPDEEVGVRLATMWSSLYGFAFLRQRGMLRPHDELIEPESERMADAVVRQAMRLILT